MEIERCLNMVQDKTQEHEAKLTIHEDHIGEQSIKLENQEDDIAALEYQIKEAKKGTEKLVEERTKNLRNEITDCREKEGKEAGAYSAALDKELENYQQRMLKAVKEWLEAFKTQTSNSQESTPRQN